MTDTPLTLSSSNAALLRGDHAEAINAYVRLLVGNLADADEVLFGLCLARRRYRKERAGKPVRVAACRDDVAKGGGRRSGANLQARSLETGLISLAFRPGGEAVSSTPDATLLLCPRIQATDTAHFAAQALDLVLAHPFDVVHLSKLRFSDILIGLLYQLVWGARIVTDLDDGASAGAGAGRPNAAEALAAGADWMQTAPDLRDLFDGVTLPAVQEPAQAQASIPAPPLDALFAKARQQALFEALGGWQMFAKAGTAVSASRIIVYTALTGGYESVKPPTVRDPAIRYLLFTDDPLLTAEGWETVVIDEPGLDPRRVSRLPKLLPHRYLPEHDISIYLDSSLTLQRGDIAALATECLQGRDIAAYPHFRRDCILDEIAECVRQGKAQAAPAAAWEKRLQDEGFPAHAGLLENAFLVRRNTPAMRALHEEWHALFTAGEPRDQFYLMYLLWKHRIAHTVIPDSKDFRKSPHVAWKSHVWRDMRPKPTINWIMNSDNVGWAYGNNAKALAAQMPQFRHVIDGEGADYDIALYFDIKLFKMHGVKARKSVLRVGGPRPLALTYGQDYQHLQADLAAFDVVIVLNSALYRTFAALHPNVHLIPNAIDVTDWAPSQPYADRRAGQPFSVGFSGNLKTTKEKTIKGYDLVVEACTSLGLPLLQFGKGAGQIAREDMPEQFYERIDCLLHPVLPGKEGCSNVIMEALAIGVPVITTPDCGFHGEHVSEGDGILYCSRSVASIKAQLSRLVASKDLCSRMSEAGRAFALAHHDISRTAPQYQAIFEALIAGPPPPMIAFVPFWDPPEAFASSRLRCLQPAALLAGTGAFRTRTDLSDDTDIAVISQLASDETFARLIAAPHIRVVYDVCDRYFADDRMVGGVNAQARFFELAERADLIVASTVDLKRQIATLGLRTPVVFIPDGLDYRGDRDSTASPADGPVVWFGNAGRGNFDSARWLIDHAARQDPRGARIIARKRFFLGQVNKGFPEFAPYAEMCTDWAQDTFIAELRKCAVCIVTHDKAEQSKSPNRLLTAVANGVPVIVATSPSCEALLRLAGLDWAIVQDIAGFEAALGRLADPAERQAYLDRIQPLVEARFGDAAIAQHYRQTLQANLPATPRHSGERLPGVLFITHNMNVGEGAPTSLMQTAIGLHEHFGARASVFSVMEGSLRQTYEAAGLRVVVPDLPQKSRLATKLMENHGAAILDALHRLIDEERPSVIVANTATTLWMANAVAERGIPVLTMIRESSAEHVALNFGKPALMAQCAEGMKRLHNTVFVAETTRSLWAASHELCAPVTIPNGIDLSHFGALQTLDKTALREELGLPTDRVILLSVGSINERKSQLDIVEAFARQPEALRARACLVLVGAKPNAYVERITARATELGIRAQLFIIPESHDVGRWYRAGDIFVFASRNESYPRVIVEAMCFGLPVISSAIFGTQEQIVEGESGFLFQPGDIDALTRLMAPLLRDTELRQQMSLAATTRFWELTTYREMLNRYRTLVANAAATSHISGDRLS